MSRIFTFSIVLQF